MTVLKKIYLQIWGFEFEQKGDKVSLIFSDAGCGCCSSDKTLSLEESREQVAHLRTLADELEMTINEYATEFWK